VERVTVAVIRSQRVVLPDGIRPADIRVQNGTIVEIGPIVGPVDRPGLIDTGDLVVLPGLVDTHVHVNDPGRSDWEGFAHATRAAAAGGVTTIVDMPLNSIPPTTSVAGLEAKRRAASGRCHVDVGFWGGVVPGNTSELAELAGRGVLGFKCFLCPSGVDEFAHVTERDLRDATPTLAALDLPLLAHAELPALLETPRGDPRAHATWLASRPPASEHAAIDLLIGLARQSRARVHIVHLAAATALPAIAAARTDGVAISVETCPHFLAFAAEDILDGATAFKCAPPIRERSQREGLWSGLREGAIDLIATDHSPAPPALKRREDGDFVRAWGGIASLQLGLSVVWTGARARNLGIERVAEWMSAAPARLARLDRRKGQIAVGHDADLVIWDPDAEWTVDAATLYHRHPITPYDGMRLSGQVKTTILRGEIIFDAGRCVGDPGGQLIAGR
jgi:allantoinase